MTKRIFSHISIILYIFCIWMIVLKEWYFFPKYFAEILCKRCRYLRSIAFTLVRLRSCLDFNSFCLISPIFVQVMSMLMFIGFVMNVICGWCDSLVLSWNKMYFHIDTVRTTSHNWGDLGELSSFPDNLLLAFNMIFVLNC